jgi:hypothetical protein
MKGLRAAIAAGRLEDFVAGYLERLAAGPL